MWPPSMCLLCTTAETTGTSRRNSDRKDSWQRISKLRTTTAKFSCRSAADQGHVWHPVWCSSRHRSLGQGALNYDIYRSSQTSVPPKVCAGIGLLFILQICKCGHNNIVVLPFSFHASTVSSLPATTHLQIDGDGLQEKTTIAICFRLNPAGFRAHSLQIYWIIDRSFAKSKSRFRFANAQWDGVALFLQVLGTLSVHLISFIKLACNLGL